VQETEKDNTSVGLNYSMARPFYPGFGTKREEVAKYEVVDGTIVGNNRGVINTAPPLWTTDEQMINGDFSIGIG